MRDVFMYLLALLGSAALALMLPGPLAWAFAVLFVAVFVGMIVNAIRGKRLREPVTREHR
jgi:uncharacterized membrane protein